MALTLTTPRFAGDSPPRIAIRRLFANTTSDNFVLPAGVGELVLHQATEAARNDGGTATLQQVVSGSNVAICTTTADGAFQKGAYFQTLGGTYNITVTRDSYEVSIYFTESVV